MPLTYDDVWTTFKDNTDLDEYSIPNDEEVIYKHIKNAVLLFNNRMRTNAICDDENEIIENVSTDDDRLIIGHFLRLTCLKHIRDFYSTLLQGFEGDVGFKNFSGQLVSVREAIVEQESLIDKLIFNSRETFL